MRLDTNMPTLQILQGQLDVALTDGDGSVTFWHLFTSFLQGSGVPFPDRFADARIHFNSIINLDAIDEAGFRARMFCWASTGSAERAADASPISVSETHHH
jgi:hypothetical protein